MYKTKQFTLIFNSLHPKTVQSPLIIFWTSGPFKYFLTRRNLTSENITNKSESCRSIFCRIEVNFMKFNTPTRTSKQSASSFVEFTKNTVLFRFYQKLLLLISNIQLPERLIRILLLIVMTYEIISSFIAFIFFIIIISYIIWMNFISLFSYSF